MKDVQKPDHLSLNTVIDRLKDGRFVIPDFQRDFEWKPWDIKELMRSIFMDYYIGSLLLWKGKPENFDALSCEVIYGFSNTSGQHPWNYGDGKPEYIVLDGQQRLTALYYTFIAPEVPLPNRSSRAVYFIHVDKFMDEDFDEAFQYEWLSKRLNRVLDNPQTQYAEHIFPLSIIGKGGWELFGWVKGYEEYWSKKSSEAELADDQEENEKAKHHAEKAREFGTYLKGITEQYQIVYIELDKDLAVDKVCDIFTQINSRGIRLDVFDLINALLKPKGLQLKHMWRDASTRLNFVDTEKMNVYILQVMSILSQSYCSPKYLYYLLPGQERQIRNPDGTRETKTLVPNIQAFQQKWDNAVNAIEKAIQRLKHPQEFGVSSSKYLPYVSILPAFSAIKSLIDELPSSRQLAAQRKFQHWYWASVFTNRYSGSVESTTSRDYNDMKSWFDDDEATPPLLQEFETRFRSLDLRKEVRRGTSVYNGVFNLFVLNGARDWVSGNIPLSGELDDHHIIPASWGQKKLGGNQINTILNRTPLSSDTNRKIINDRLPNTYLPEMMVNNKKEQVEAMLQRHFISPKALEILLKNPAFDIEKYQSFFGLLEYFDLRELQDTIISKSVWEKFESKFLKKESLILKFDQLAELRNSIRHSRSVDEINCKE